MGPTGKYELRAELRLHSADVRGVAVLRAGAAIASASRDHSLALWAAPDSDAPAARAGAAFDLAAAMQGHQNFVNAVIALTGVRGERELLVSASADKTVAVWDVATASRVAMGGAHSASVCSLAQVSLERLGSLVSNPSSALAAFLSCSWDHTARLWLLSTSESNQELDLCCVQAIDAHEGPVWDACEVEALDVSLTCGGDRRLAAWSHRNSSSHLKSSACIGSVVAHDDVARAVCSLSRSRVASASNDGSVRIWALTRSAGAITFQCCRVLAAAHSGHFVYSLAAALVPAAGPSSFSGEPGFLLCSGGEDNCANLMHGSESEAGGIAVEVLQSIPHCGTVWTVALDCARGDVVTGCSDGVVRVFTRDRERMAPDEVREAYAAAVKSREIAAQTVSDVDVTKLPSSDAALAKPGSREGENKLVRNAVTGKAEAYMWSATEQKWEKVGDVVDKSSAAGGGGLGGVQTMINGKLYDFAFDVELIKGEPNRKLGFNRGENPYVAAQRFIDDNEISQEFLDQIASFIEQQVPAYALDDGTSAASDPFTGGNRYIPRSSGSAFQSAAGASASDGSPFTADRYRPGGSSVTASNGSAGIDGSPLTAGRYRPVGMDDVSQKPGSDSANASKHIPYAHGMIVFSHSDILEKIEAKLVAYDGAAALDDVQKTTLHSVFNVLRADSSLAVFTDEQLELVCSMLSWPVSSVFPVVDVLRLVIARPSGSAYIFGAQQKVDVLSKIVEYFGMPDAPAPVLIMALRLLCNMFRNRISGGAVRQNMERVIAAACPAAERVAGSDCGSGGGGTGEKVREALSALLLNYAQLVASSAGTWHERSILIRSVLRCLTSFRKDPKELHTYRLLVALGTLAHESPAGRDLVLELEGADAIAAVAHVSARVRSVAEEIAKILVL